MNAMFPSSLRVAFLLSAGWAAAGSASRCMEVAFNVSGSALNRNVTGLSLDPDSLILALQAVTFPQVLVSGHQTLAGSYCAPSVQNENWETLQVLFHGITGNRDYWSALGGTSLGFAPYEPANYSWVDYMNAQGYPTLALDRLGAGKSSHPDPILVVQGPYEDALYHDLVTQIKAGSTGQLPQSYSKLVYVGHSYGSELGTTSAQKFPGDFEAYLLTGFSKSVRPSLPGVTLQTPLPAAIVDPGRFGTLAPGFLTAPIEATHTDSFFGSPVQVDFDPGVSHQFFTTEDVVSVGQFISTYAGPVVAPLYSGRVMVLTGEQDQAFCGPGSPVLGPASCGPLLSETRSLFPVADYNWKSVNRTGHALHLHLSSQKSFNIAAEFLAGTSFAGGPPA